MRAVVVVPTMNWPELLSASLTLFISATVAFRDGDVRLAGSDRYGEGRVEVFFQGAWGTICQNGWDLDDAQVICRQLGFSNGAQRVFGGATFGEGSGSVLLSDVECDGDEEMLTQCDNTVWNANECSHEGDVGVRCNAPTFEGCFPTSRLQTAVSRTISTALTFESCYGYCSTLPTRYLWLEGGDTCVCVDSIPDSASQIEGCNTPCTGDDWICGGPGEASLYTARVNLPFAGSSGFPGMVGDDSIRDTWRFRPEGSHDYIYARVHLFDIPSTDVKDLISNSDAFEVVNGSSEGVLLVSTTAAEIEVRYPGTDVIGDGYHGFLFQFGQGTFCPPPVALSDGTISTTSVEPFTVGDYFRLTCKSGFRAFDREVFCQADGTLNRQLLCMPITEPTTMAPVVPTTSEPPPGPVTPSRNVTPRVTCDVPVVDNGKVNATAIRVMLGIGDVLEVSCNPIYEPVNSTATCGSDGKFFPPPECQRVETLFIILLVIIGIVALLVIILLILLVGCACYFRIRKRRRVRGYQRRNNVEVIAPNSYSASANNAFEMTESNDSDEDDSIAELPSGGVPPPPPPPNSAPPPPPPPDDAPPGYSSFDGGEAASRGGAAAAAAGGTTTSAEIGEDAANALRGLNDVVDDAERDGLYRQVVRPTIAAAGGFGGHFARS